MSVPRSRTVMAGSRNGSPCACARRMSFANLIKSWFITFLLVREVADVAPVGCCRSGAFSLVAEPVQHRRAAIQRMVSELSKEFASIELVLFDLRDGLQASDDRVVRLFSVPKSTAWNWAIGKQIG